MTSRQCLFRIWKLRSAAALRRLYGEWTDKPTAITLPFVMISAGVTAIIIGDNASQAFTNLGGGLIIRCMGTAMALGGSLVVASVLNRDPLWEVIGLAVAALGAAIYGTGVMLGLGEQGLIAGQLSLGIAIAFLGRIRLLVRAGAAKRPPDVN